MKHFEICLKLGLIFSSAVPLVDSLTLDSSVHCAVRREISPCTCYNQEMSFKKTKLISVTCEEMTSFQQVVKALKNKFEREADINLKISFSTLDDLPQLTFQDLGLTILHLHLINDNLRSLPESVFIGLSRVEYFSLEGNRLEQVPQQVLKFMKRIKTLNLGIGRIENITSTDLENLPEIKTLVLDENKIVMLEANSLPKTVVKLQLARNNIKSLNGTLRHLKNLQWLIINDNEIESLDDELPMVNPNTKMVFINAASNKLTKLPDDLRHYFALDTVTLGHNSLLSLNGSLSKCRRLQRLDLSFNSLTELSEDEFADLVLLEELMLQNNNITLLNRSLTTLKSLKMLNLSFNSLKHFSLQEIKGLTRLKMVDLSHNDIESMSGKLEQNIIDLNTKVYEMRLDHNKLSTLSGSLSGLAGLVKLNISHNEFVVLAPEDFIGLDELQLLDVSHNKLLVLFQAPMTILPKLEELMAPHNFITTLEEDFYALPILCRADLSYNLVETISSKLSDRTQCRVHNVNSTLRIYLQGSPILCNPLMAERIIALESKNNTKIHGTTDCTQYNLNGNTTGLMPVTLSA